MVSAAFMKTLSDDEEDLSLAEVKGLGLHSLRSQSILAEKKANGHSGRTARHTAMELAQVNLTMLSMSKNFSNL